MYTYIPSSIRIIIYDQSLALYLSLFVYHPILFFHDLFGKGVDCPLAKSLKGAPPGQFAHMFRCITPFCLQNGEISSTQINKQSLSRHPSTIFNPTLISKKSSTGPTERTPKPEYLIALASYSTFHPEKTWVSNNSHATYWTGSVGIRSHSIFDGYFPLYWLFNRNPI